MEIAVASKGRAGDTTTDKVFGDNCVFYVPKSEIHQYEQFVANVVPVPNEVQGITKTRNWILKNQDANKSGHRIVMIDDDVKACGWVELEERKSKKRLVIDQEFWFNEFEKLFDVTEQMNYKIWGIRTESSPRATYPYTPFLFRSYVTASCMGIINDGTYYFDESYVVKEDYEICLRHVKELGGIISAKFLFWENSHWEDEGGCKDYRTVEVEREAISKLINQYPGMLKSVSRKANKFTIQLNL